jgi:UDP-glucose 4-epimerase
LIRRPEVETPIVPPTLGIWYHAPIFGVKLKEMPTSLVTGGAGFIGAHVCRRLIEKGHQVIVLDDLSGGFKENLPNSVQFYHGSILDEVLLDELFQENDIDYVYHLAAYAAEGLSHFIKSFNYKNNLIGSVHLINRSIKNNVKCFVFTSSIAVYGTNQVPMVESMMPQPEDPYGIAKYAVEQDLHVSKSMFGLDYIIFRPHNVYGEYQNLGDRYRNVVGIFMNQLMQGKPLTIFGDGEQTRAFSYIGDVAPYIADSVESPELYGNTYNIGGDQEYTVNYLAKVVMDALNLTQPLRYLPKREEVKHAYADHSKVHNAFGIDPSTMVKLEDGIKKMANWAMSVGVKKSNKFENIEITTGLPSVWLED